MAVILSRLQSCGIDIPVYLEGSDWVLTQNLREKNPTVDHHYFVSNHQLLLLEYHVCCTQLAHDLAHLERTGAHPSTITKQIEEALVLAELLAYIFQYYLDVPREVARLSKEQRVYRHLLVARGYHFSDVGLLFQSDTPYTKHIRDGTVAANWLRLFSARARRLLIAVAPLAQDYQRFCKLVGQFEAITAPVFAYLGWVFFIPRLSTNLFLTFKHVIRHDRMSDQERSLGWQTRFVAQMERRWPELANDIVWFTLGILNCFVLTGALSPIGAVAGIIFQGYDLVLACVRAHTEITRWEGLVKQYRDIRNETVEGSVKRQEVENHLKYLQQRISYERNKLILSVINNAILVIGFAMTFPGLALFPVLPLIGAVIIVLNTLVCFILVQWLESQKPTDKVTLPKSEDPIVRVSDFDGSFFPQPRPTNTFPDNGHGLHPAIP